MPGRNLQGAGQYRYGYQGQYAETDFETGKPAFELRLYDPRINRWLTTDPAGQYASPYMSMGNNWVNSLDPDGGKDIRFDKNGNVITDSNGNIKYFNDNFFHNLIFGTRTLYETANGKFKTFDLGDPDADLADIEAGFLDKIQFVSEGQVEQLLEQSGVYDAAAQNDPYGYIRREGVGFRKLDFANTPTGISTIFSNTSSSLFIIDKPFINGGGKVGLNQANFGNFLIGGASSALRIPVDVMLIGAHLNSIDFWGEAVNGYRPQLDSSDDQYAIWLGSWYTLTNGLHYSSRSLRQGN